MAQAKVIAAIVVSVGLVIVGIALGIHFGIQNKDQNQAGSSVHDGGNQFPSDGDPLEFFQVDDALKINWYHGANSLAQMEEALAGDFQMLEGDIILRWNGWPNQTNEPVMAHPPLYNSDNTLQNWLDNILARTDKAPKLDFKGDEVIEPSLMVLQGVADAVNHPIWANADIVQGPGTSNVPIDAERFFNLVNQYFPNMTLSLGWTTGCCDEMFTQEMMEEMWSKIMNIPQPVTLPARAALLKGSWPQFKWLLEKDPSRFTITVWTPQGALSWEDASIYDLLYVRNDADKRLIYYDLPEPKFSAFRQLSITAGSPLNYFDSLAGKRDALMITWAHGVNSQQELEDALNSDVMMLEADVLLRGQGTPNQTDIPVMAHPPDIDSDITLEEWITRVITTDKGVKLDFKSIEVLEPAMLVLNQFRGSYKQPIWLNSDIFNGPNSPDSTPVNATRFREIILEHFPECTLSIGWKTSYPGLEIYTEEMIEEMATYARDLQQPITYPVRARFVKDSWTNLKSLLDESRGYTLSIWSGSSDIVDPDDLVFVRQNAEADRVYYDLPEWLMNAFLDRLNGTNTNNTT